MFPLNFVQILFFYLNIAWIKTFPKLVYGKELDRGRREVDVVKLFY